MGGGNVGSRAGGGEKPGREEAAAFWGEVGQVRSGDRLALRTEMRTIVALPFCKSLSPGPREERARILGLELELGSGHVQGETKAQRQQPEWGGGLPAPHSC